MPQLTTSFLFDFQSNIQVISEEEYVALAQSENLWWPRVMSRMTSKSRKEIVATLLSTASIEYLGLRGGSMQFEDLVSRYFEYESLEAGVGLRLHRYDIEDDDGKGIEGSGQWSRDVASYMVYWPQKQCVRLLKNGHSSGYVSYDGEIFFSKAHPLNPFAAHGYTYANLMTGAAASTASTDPNDAIYPGACPIDTSVTLDQARINLGKVFTYIRSQRMPNGVDPRYLKPRFLIGGPALQERMVQLCKAKFLAQAAVTGGGSADFEAVLQSWQLAEPIIEDGLADFESGTSYFIACESPGTQQIGGLTYVDREAFKINFYGAMDEAQLNRMNQLEYQCKGRNVAGFGHPYKLIKVKAT